jgi:predicted AAA+ superfamily ATPase
MQYKRLIRDNLRRATEHFPAVVLTGSRQTGKTTLLRQLFPKHSYVSLDLPSDAQMAEEDPATFLSRYPPPVVIDEVQYAPKLFRHLKVAIDKDRKAYGRFILTGSQKFTLMKEVSDSLAGRCAVLDIETLAIAELGEDFANSMRTSGLPTILCRGFYPQLWDEPDFPRDEFFRSYIATYIERDVRQILNITSLRDFDRFMRVCAVRTGQIVNKTEIAKEVGISTKTANDWLSIMHASNQIVLLEPYFANVGKRAVKSPKLYFTDPGLVSFLIGINKDTILQSAHLGHIWETFVFAELRKSVNFWLPEATLWFYRDHQRECDFILSYGGRLTFMDAKWKEVPTEKDFGAVNQIRGYFKQAQGPSHLVTSAVQGFPVGTAGDVVSAFALDAFIQSFLAK